MPDADARKGASCCQNGGFERTDEAGAEARQVGLRNRHNGDAGQDDAGGSGDGGGVGPLIAI